MSKEKYYTPIPSDNTIDEKSNQPYVNADQSMQFHKSYTNSNSKYNNQQNRSNNGEINQNSSRYNNKKHKDHKKQKNNFFMKVIFDLKYINHRHI